MGFRFRPGLGMSYERQGHIYFASRTYPDQPKRVREKIMRLCHECGGEHWQALFEYVTQDISPVALCRRHFIGRETLYRALRAYYRRF